MDKKTMNDIYDKLENIPESKHDETEQMFTDWLRDRSYFPEDEDKVCQAIYDEMLYSVSLDWPSPPRKERHVSFKDSPAPEGTGADFSFGAVQVFILQPNEKIRWHCTSHESYDFGPGIHIATVHHGIRQMAYYGHSKRAWEYLGSLATIGAATCRKEGFYYRTAEAEQYCKEDDQ